MRIQFTSDVIRPIRLDDVSQRWVSWLSDPVVTRYSEQRFQTHTLASQQAFVRDTLESDVSGLLGIFQKDVHVGVVSVSALDRNHCTAEIAFLIGEPSCWGKGLGSLAVSIVAERVAFDELGVRKLYAGAYSGNIGSRRVLEKSGFQLEAVLKAQYVHEAGLMDHVQYCRFRDENRQ